MQIVPLYSPQVEPVLLAEIKSFLRIDPNLTVEDDLLKTLIIAARIFIERYIKKALIAQGWSMRLDRLPSNGIVNIPIGPLIEVSAIEICKRIPHVSMVHGTDYIIDKSTEGNRIYFKEHQLQSEKISIDLVVGYGSTCESIPQELRLAFMMLVTRWYEYRDGICVNKIPSNIRDPLEALLAPHRFIRLG